MSYCGQISKMLSTLEKPIYYQLPIGKDIININDLLNMKVTIKYNGEIKCIACDKKIYKTYMQGYCYPCFISLPQTSECVFKPHLCKAHEGEARDMKWAQKNCLDTTYVYLSLTSNVKVGVTRHANIPSRWVDQGAHYAIKLAKTPNRYLAGMIEVELSKYISDRTKWRQMIQGKYDMINLLELKSELLSKIPKEYQEYIINEDELVKLEYPMMNIPEKIKSFNLDKNPELSGVLTGIKGQYIVIDNEFVLNVRKYTGYFISIDYE